MGNLPASSPLPFHPPPCQGRMKVPDPGKPRAFHPKPAGTSGLSPKASPDRPTNERQAQNVKLLDKMTGDLTEAVAVPSRQAIVMANAAMFVALLALGFVLVGAMVARRGA